MFEVCWYLISYKHLRMIAWMLCPYELHAPANGRRREKNPYKPGPVSSAVLEMSLVPPLLVWPGRCSSAVWLKFMAGEDPPGEDHTGIYHSSNQSTLVDTTVVYKRSFTKSPIKRGKIIEININWNIRWPSGSWSGLEGKLAAWPGTSKMVTSLT